MLFLEQTEMFSVHTRFQKMHLISDPVAGPGVYPVWTQAFEIWFEMLYIVWHVGKHI